MKPQTEQPSHHSEIQELHLEGKMAPRWLAIVGVLLLGIIFAALPESLTLGPTWIVLAIEGVLFLPVVIALLLRRPLPFRVSRTIALISLAVVTLALLIGVVLFVSLLGKDKLQGTFLLRSAALLWAGNILVFALWYWEVDGGGPRKRHLAKHTAQDFMFPQQANGASWVPHFIDYLFLAFTGATAFSPADTIPLTHVAKVLMMLEAIISMMILVILAARAVNILGP